MDFYSKERGLQLIRSATLPRNPLDTSDIANIFNREDIQNLLGKTKTSSIFYDMLEGNGYSACIFSSKDSINVFEQYAPCGEREIVLDGTFDIVPVGAFKQLLVIYGVYMEKVGFLWLLFLCYERIKFN